MIETMTLTTTIIVFAFFLAFGTYIAGDGVGSFVKYRGQSGLEQFVRVVRTIIGLGIVFLTLIAVNIV
jgi:hypothetical protein